MRYPKYHGQKLNEEKRKAFDYWREKFSSNMDIDNESQKLGLTKKNIDMLAWNCAYEATTDQLKSKLDTATKQSLLEDIDEAIKNAEEVLKNGEKAFELLKIIKETIAVRDILNK